MNNPDQASVAAYNAFSCPADGTLPVVDDDPAKPLVTCDDKGTKYLLSKPIIEGTQLKDASAGIPDKSLDWAVSLELDGDGAKVLSQVSNALTGDQSKLFAITLDGSVISSAYFSQAINDGNAQISGNFTQQSAKDLSTSLKFGSLPIAFEDDPTKEEIGPSLAGDQLSAGITAGIVGLALVMIYCLFYYRGLGLVVIASLVVAAITTYGMVLLLAKTAGFTLTLPGIAGLIVAVGITADSFIVFFERIRDEMREGKSMRVAVESGWVRARNTCLAADSVSLLAAVVLYIFAAGVVKGFAFALGLSTIIDLVVFFWFTKPMVSWLGHFSFFNKGHRLSGLDAENLGLARPAGATVGGKA
jgi:preprotein translocase subunit SecD